MKEKKTAPRRMRIAALQCDFEGGPDKTLLVPQKWKDFGFNTEQLFHTHSELYTALYQKDKHQKVLLEYFAKEKEAGIDVILYMNCHLLSPSQSGMLDKWAVRKKDGSFTKLYENVYNTPCLRSEWTDYFLSLIGELKGFDIAGIFFDGPVMLECFCPVCRKKYQEETGRSLDEASPAETSALARRAFLDFVGKSYRKVKETNPSWLSYTNLGILHGQWSADEMSEMLGYEDIIGTEGGFQFYGPPKNTPQFKCGLSAKAAEAVSGGCPTVIFMAGDHKPWSWYLHTAAETKLCYASASAGGASVWYGIHCSTDMLDSRAGAAAKEMVRFDKKYERLLAGSESAAETALFYSFNTAKNYKSSASDSDLYGKAGGSSAGLGDYMDGLNGAALALTHAGIPFDVVTELCAERLSKYKTIIIPNAACLDDASVSAIRAFAGAGGVIIADGETSLFDGERKERKDFALADVFGAKFAGARSKYNNWDYFTLDPEYSWLIGDGGVKYIPAPFAAADILTASGKVAARLCKPLPGRYAGKPAPGGKPLVIDNSYGKGRSYFIAGTFFGLYGSFGIVQCKEILRSLITLSNPPALELPGVPGAVEISVRRAASGETLVWLVNYTGAEMTRPIDKVVPVRGAELVTRGAFTKARALVSGKKLRATRPGAFALPEFDEFELIVLE